MLSSNTTEPPPPLIGPVMFAIVLTENSRIAELAEMVKSHVP
jgi:hypothetical protein